MTKLQLTNEQVDRMLGAAIPGGSHARDWFLPHEQPRGLANVRDVVRAMVDAVAFVAAGAVQAECERCAAIADDEARIRESAGLRHPEGSEARDRCFAAARAAANVAKGIRCGEVVDAVSAVTTEQEAQRG